MKTIDLRRKLKPFYSPSSRSVQIVDVPRFNFLMLDGSLRAGESPSTSKSFREAIGAMYGVAFTLKFMSKLRKRNPVDFPVMALEGLWWSQSGRFDPRKRVPWSYRLLILQPAHITRKMFNEAVEQVRAKRPSPSLPKVRLRSFREGRCMQILHVGPYSKEPATIDRMQEFARGNGYRLRGKHHEIYLGDPRRARPERLKTILRQPIVSSRRRRS